METTNSFLSGLGDLVSGIGTGIGAATGKNRPKPIVAAAAPSTNWGQFLVLGLIVLGLLGAVFLFRRKA